MDHGKPTSWLSLLVGLAAVYILFENLANYLGSVRGEQGLLIVVAVISALLLVERVLFAEPLGLAVYKLGLASSTPQAIAAAIIVSALLCLVIPAFAFLQGTTLSFDAAAPRLVVGLFAQAGVAEEALFRGYLFRHLRTERTFWHAAWLSMLPFAVVHLMIFLTLPWPIALASILLSMVISFPLAWLFEIGRYSIWAPAILHATIQGAIKVTIVSGDAADQLPYVWMAAAAVIPFLVFLVPRPQYEWEDQ